MKKKTKVGDIIWIVILTILSLLWIYPAVMILINSLKQESAISTGTVFKLPTADTFAGLSNYLNAIESKGFLSSFCYSLFITVSSVAAILLFCSMCAWYISRVKGMLSQALYFLFAFFHGGTVPDGYVYPVSDRRQITSEHSLEYLGDLSRFRCRTCRIHVLRLYEIHSCGSGRGRAD